MRRRYSPRIVDLLAILTVSISILVGVFLSIIMLGDLTQRKILRTVCYGTTTADVEAMLGQPASVVHTHHQIERLSATQSTRRINGRVYVYAWRSAWSLFLNPLLVYFSQNGFVECVFGGGHVMLPRGVLCRDVVNVEAKQHPKMAGWAEG